MIRLLSILATTFFATTALAGFQGINGSTNLGVFNKVTCSTGLTCTKVKDAFSIVSSPLISSGAITVTGAASTSATIDLQADANASNGDDWQIKNPTGTAGQPLTFLNNTSGSQVTKWSVDSSGNVIAVGSETVTGAIIPNGGLANPAADTAPRTRYKAFVPQPVTNATSVTGLTTTVYLTQIFVPYNTTLTGAAVLNAATVGTNKWLLALFNSAGTALANTATAGTLTAGASAFQSINFTGTVAVKGPATYWVGLYVNGTTDTYYSIPTLGQTEGLAGSVTGQTFGTVASVTLPTTFTAGVAPVVYVY
jgi:hypothetical protein